MVKWSNYLSRIPSEIKIGKSNYRIMWTDEFPKDKKQLGETTFSPEKYIVIKLFQSHKETIVTYLHELVHVMSEEFGIGLTESQVEKFEKAFPYILKKGIVFKEEVKNASIKRKRRNTKKVR